MGTNSRHKAIHCSHIYSQQWLLRYPILLIFSDFSSSTSIWLRFVFLNSTSEWNHMVFVLLWQKAVILKVVSFYLKTIWDPQQQGRGVTRICFTGSADRGTCSGIILQHTPAEEVHSLVHSTSQISCPSYPNPRSLGQGIRVKCLKMEWMVGKQKIF